MKRIGVNTRLLIKNKLDGIGWYQYEILKRITTAHPEHQFYFFFDRPYNEEFVFSKNVTPVVLGPQARHSVLFKIWFNRSIKKALKKYQIDLFFSPDGYLSLTTDVKQVGTFHDLNFEHYPEDLKPSHRRFYQTQFPLFAARAEHLITVSDFSRKDIIERYKVDAEKLTVVYNGVHEGYMPIDEPTRIAIQNQFSKGQPYFLHVGSLHPRKNIARLITAFGDFKKNGAPHQLVLAGATFSWTAEMEAALNNCDYKGDIIKTGRLLQTDIINLMGGAEALTYVSYFEGFGMPVLEAMRTGTPVIAANCTSIPEVAGQAAILVDPFSTEEIARAMEQIQHDPALRKKLIEKGVEQVKKFSWDKCSRETWEVLEKTMNHATPLS